MKGLLMLLFGLLFFYPDIISQNVIYGTGPLGSKFYYGNIDQNFLNTIIQERYPGDTLYLPGGNFSLSGDVNIDRRLVIIGAGIQPDSSAATGITIFEQGTDFQFKFFENADGSEIHGIDLDDNDFETELFESIDGLKFVRCKFGSAKLNDESSSALFQECIGGNINVADANSVVIKNCIFEELLNGGASTIVENCIILDNTSFANTNKNVTYRNNIFTRNSGETVAISEESNFVNNLWIAKIPSQAEIVFEPGAMYSNNLKTNNISDVFVSATNYINFEFGVSYEIVTGSIYETMGTNSSEVGVFGGPSPMKKGLQPFNPHWQEFNLPIATQGGVLRDINIKASAQQY